MILGNYVLNASYSNEGIFCESVKYKQYLIIEDNKVLGDDCPYHLEVSAQKYNIYLSRPFFKKEQEGSFE